MMYNFQEKWQEKVYQILLTPIKCDQQIKTIELKNNVIFTGQTYNSISDADMSDFAIGFYEILYKDILKSKILDDQGDLIDDEFAGDTMNSFNTLANITRGAGKSRKARTPITKWPDYLKEYYNKYHCLANFWLIPSVIGRTNKPLSKAREAKDYMDRFLTTYNKKQEEYNQTFKKYFSSFKNYYDFAKANYLLGSYINDEINLFSTKNTSEEIIKNIMKLIEARAMSIANSKNAKELWNYFNELNLFTIK